MKYLKWLRRCLQVICTGLPAALPAQNVMNFGARIVMTGPVQIVFHNAGLTNSGPWTMSQDAAAWFTGDQPVKLLGWTTLAFSNVVINKPSGGVVQLNQDMDISGKITMISGNVLLNGRILNLGSTGSIEGESNQSFISGKTGGIVLVKRKVTIPMNAFNPGNIGVALTSGVVPGILTVERRHVQEAVNPGEFSIQRSFTISATNNPPLNATLRFYYLDEELAGNIETGIAMWTRSGVTSPWTLIGKDASDVNDNWVEKSQLSHWGSFTLGEPLSQSELMQRSKKLKDQNVDEYREPLKVQVYPNPSADIFNLVFSGTQEKDAVISLYNQEGQLMQQKKIRYKTGVNTVRWNLAHQAAGVYFIMDNTGVINVKLIKQ